MKNPLKKILYLPLHAVLHFMSGKLRYQKFFEALHAISLEGMNFGEGWKVDNSGEVNFIRILVAIPPDRPCVFFDVGANNGTYAEIFRREMSRGPHNATRVFCFEPSKSMFEKLKSTVKGDNISFHNFALSDSNEKSQLYSDQKRPGLASVYKRKLDHFNIQLDHVEEIETKTLDSFCRENGISYVSFVKIDAEGHEFKILNGAKDMIAKDSIDIIQFEFGGCNIDSRTFFQDFYYLLNPKFKIYRIVKDGLCLVSRYEEKKEIFINTNYVAVRRGIDLPQGISDRA